MNADQFTEHVERTFQVGVVWEDKPRSRHSPEIHHWDGQQFVWNRQLYSENGLGGMVHEVAHYLECLNYRPHALRKPNWGLSDDEYIGWCSFEFVDQDAAIWYDTGLARLYEQQVVWSLERAILRTLPQSDAEVNTLLYEKEAYRSHAWEPDHWGRMLDLSRGDDAFWRVQVAKRRKEARNERTG